MPSALLLGERTAIDAMTTPPLRLAAAAGDARDLWRPECGRQDATDANLPWLAFLMYQHTLGDTPTLEITLQQEVRGTGQFAVHRGRAARAVLQALARIGAG